MNGVFQDIDLNTGELVYEWSAIDHVALSEGYVLPNTTEVVGTGFSAVGHSDMPFLSSSIH